MSTLPKIIAVDFDGTLFENAWPDVGAPIEKNINKLKAEQADGAKVILWTNRVGGALDKAVNFCKEHGIHLDAVNENLPEIVQGFGTDCRKIFANEYWDDHAVWMSKQDIGEFSDGFHTFNSLYHQRLILFAALVNTFHCILDILDYRNWRDSFQILRTRKRMARMRIYFERRLPNDHCLYRRTAERQNHNAY